MSEWMINYKVLGCIQRQMSSTDNKCKRKEEVTTSSWDSHRSFPDKKNFMLGLAGWDNTCESAGPVPTSVGVE